MDCIAHYAIECPDVEGIPTEEEFQAAYRDARGEVRDWDYAAVFGQWRVAAISAIGFSRFPAELKHLEKKYWKNSVDRLDAFMRRAGAE
jgi:hypothetical protein